MDFVERWQLWFMAQAQLARTYSFLFFFFSIKFPGSDRLFLSSSIELISTQILLGIGGSFNVVGSRVASQASVPHQDLASVIALLSLWTQLGGSAGSAIATAWWKWVAVFVLFS